MGKVALEGIEFFAYHGYYEEQRKIGNKYEVNIEITSDLSEAAKSDSLSGTINYEILYKIIWISSYSKVCYNPIIFYRILLYLHHHIFSTQLKHSYHTNAKLCIDVILQENNLPSP